MEGGKHVEVTRGAETFTEFDVERFTDGADTQRTATPWGACACVLCRTHMYFERYARYRVCEVVDVLFSFFLNGAHTRTNSFAKPALRKVESRTLTVLLQGYW